MSVLAATLFDVEIWDAERLGELMYRFTLSIAVAALIIGIYYRREGSSEYARTFFVFNVAVFFLVYVMNGLDLDVGFGFGLFALFAVLRFRTVPIPYYELTIAFAVIAVAVVNAITVGALTHAEVWFANIGIAATVYIVGLPWLGRSHAVQQVRYERIENVRPDRVDELHADLRDRMGLDVVSVRIEEVDFLNDTAVLRVTHRHPAP